MRKKIVAGNWKMNLDYENAQKLIISIKEKTLNINNGVEIILCPPTIYTDMALKLIEKVKIQIGVQNVSNKQNGAFTGEISAEMLRSIGVKYAIVGHSERRSYFNETDEIIFQKIKMAINNAITPIYCCGETLLEREKNKHFETIENQISTALFQLNDNEITKIVIAYEPVWAIGTGKTATVEQAQEMHEFIRRSIEKQYNQVIANSISILYGGSCNSQNAKSIFLQKDVDGGLIGGASLKDNDFITIINSF